MNKKFLLVFTVIFCNTNIFTSDYFSNNIFKGPQPSPDASFEYGVSLEEIREELVKYYGEKTGEKEYASFLDRNNLQDFRTKKEDVVVLKNNLNSVSTDNIQTNVPQIDEQTGDVSDLNGKYELENGSVEFGENDNSGTEEKNLSILDNQESNKDQEKIINKFLNHKYISPIVSFFAIKYVKPSLLAVGFGAALAYLYQEEIAQKYQNVRLYIANAFLKEKNNDSQVSVESNFN